MPLPLPVLQDEDEVAAPFGAFMQALPHWGFIVIHSTLILLAVRLSRKASPIFSSPTPSPRCSMPRRS